MADEIMGTQNTEQPKASGETETKTFTNEQLGNLITKKEREAAEKVLKDLGFESVEGAKDTIKKAKEKLDAEKTDLQRAVEKNKELESEILNLKTKNEMDNLKFVALGKGILSDKVDKALKLAETYEGENFDQKIDKMLVDFPNLKGQKSQQSAAFGAEAQKQTISEADRALAIARKSAGIM